MLCSLNQERGGNKMSKPTSAVKRRYNKVAYNRYEFSLGKDSILTYKLDEHKAKGGNVTELIKMALAAHFGLNENDLTFPYVPKTGEWNYEEE